MVAAGVSERAGWSLSDPAEARRIRSGAGRFRREEWETVRGTTGVPYVRDSRGSRTPRGNWTTMREGLITCPVTHIATFQNCWFQCIARHVLNEKSPVS